MKVDSKHSQSGLKLFTFLEEGKLAEFRKWLKKHSSFPLTDGINEGCGKYKCSVLLKAASMPEVKWEEIVMLIDRYKADMMKKDVNRWTILHWAAYGNNAYITRKLIQRYDQVRQMIDNQSSARQPGDSAILTAAINGHYDTFHQLLEGGADPLLVNSQGKTVLDVLRDQGRRPDIQRVIQASIEQNRVCLIEAASKGHWDVLRRVLYELKENDEIKQRGKSGESLLHVVTCEGQSDILELLLKRNVDPNIADYKGYTPLFCTVDSTSSAACAEHLLRHNADATLLDKSDCTIFHHIAYEGRSDILQAVKECVPQDVLISVINALCGTRTLHSPILPRRVTLQGTALQIAILMGREECVSLLVELGADIYGKDMKGRTVIEIIQDARSSDTGRNVPELDKMLALLYKFDPTWQQAKRLIEVHYDPDFRCPNGETLLHMACKLCDSPRTVRLFLDNLADPNLLDENQYSPIFYAVTSKTNRCGEIIQLLLDFDAAVVYTGDGGILQNMLIVALLCGNIPAANVLYDTKTRLVKNDMENSRLSMQQFMLLVLKGYTESLRFLREQVRLTYFDQMLNSNEQVAVSDIIQHCRGDVTGLRSQALVYVNVTPLHAAALCCHANMVQFLLHCGIGSNQLNSKGETALDLVRRYNNPSEELVRSIVTLLTGQQTYVGAASSETISCQNETSSAFNSCASSMPYLQCDATPVKLGDTAEFAPRMAATTLTSYTEQNEARPSFEGPDFQQRDPKTHTNKTWHEIRTLLESGYDINNSSKDGRILLHYFSEQAKSLKIIELLLQFSADPNASDKQGNTALGFAVVSTGPRKRDVICQLLDYGAKLSGDSQQGLNPFRKVLSRQETDIAETLFQYFPQEIQKDLEKNRLCVEYIHDLVISNKLSMLDFLRDKIQLSYLKAHLEALRTYKIPPTLTEDIPLATLLESNQDISHVTKTVSFAGDLLCAGSALHVASVQCDVALVKCVIKCGVNVDVRDARGRSPLHLLQACQLFVKEEFKSQLFEICVLLGASPATFMSSMTSIADSVNDDITLDDMIAHAQHVTVEKREILKVKADVHSILDDCFETIEKLFESGSSITTNIRLRQIKESAQNQIDTRVGLLSLNHNLPLYNPYLNVPFGSTKSLVDKTSQAVFKSSCDSIARDDAAQAFATYRLVQASSLTDQNNPRHRPDQTRIVSSAASSHISTANSQMARWNEAYDDVTSYELFGHIAQRMAEKGYGWEELIDKLTVDQDKQIKERIAEDIEGADHGKPYGRVYEALILWKLYSTDPEQRGKRLRQALDALGIGEATRHLRSGSMPDSM